MKRDHWFLVAHTVLACTVLACTALALLLTPTIAQSVQLERLPSSAITGNPVEDRITAPIAPAPQKRPSVEPLKNQLVLQAEIDNLKIIASKANAAITARTPAAAQLQRRQSASAAWVLGLLYANGVGVDIDFSEAHIRFKQANQLGEPLSMAGLAWCEIQGCETLPSAHEARILISQLRSTMPGRAVYFEWLAEQTFLPLQVNSASSATNIDRLAAQSRQLLLNSAKTQDVQALIELGFDAVSNERLKEAHAFFAAAAPNSAVAAQNAALIQARQSNNQANCKIQNAADLSDIVLLNSAQALHRGKGCQVNYAEAIRLYNLAANKGNEAAKRMLSLIYSKPDTGGNINIAWMQQLANLNAANLSLNIDSATLAPMLKREPTPLFDLIPQSLRSLANTQNP